MLIFLFFLLFVTVDDAVDMLCRLSIAIDVSMDHSFSDWEFALH